MCVGVAHDGESGGAVAMSMLCVMHHMHVVCICVCLVAGEQESGGVWSVRGRGMGGVNTRALAWMVVYLLCGTSAAGDDPSCVWREERAGVPWSPAGGCGCS